MIAKERDRDCLFQSPDTRFQEAPIWHDFVAFYKGKWKVKILRIFDLLKNGSFARDEESEREKKRQREKPVAIEMATASPSSQTSLLNYEYFILFNIFPLFVSKHFVCFVACTLLKY